MSLLDLPTEILYQVALYANDLTNLKLFRTCSSMAEIYRDPIFWKHRVKNRFPNLEEDRFNWWFTDPEFSDSNPHKNYVRLVTGQGAGYKGGATYGSENYLSINYLIGRAARNGDLDLLKYFVKFGGDYKEGIYDVQNKEVIEWLINKGITPSTLGQGAGLSGNLDLVKWLILEKGASHKSTIYGAMLSGDLGLVKWLLNTIEELEIGVYFGAGRSGNIELVKWLVEIKGINPVNFYEGVALSGNIKLVKWLINDKGVPLYHQFLGNGSAPVKWKVDTEIAKWLIDVKERPPTIGVRSAGEQGNLELVKWLIDVKGSHINGMFSRVNSLDLIKWLVDVKDTDIYNITDFIKGTNNVEIIQWLINVKGINPNMFVCSATECGNLKLIEWLYKVKGVIFYKPPRKPSRYW